MGRKILGVFVGFILAMAIIFVVQMIGSMFAPQPPKNIEFMSSEEKRAFVSSLPIGAYLTVLFGYMLGSFGGGWIAAKMHKDRAAFWPSLVVGALLTIGALYNFYLLLPGQPAWFVAVCLLIFIPLALLGHKTAR